ncbi:Enterobactin synthase component E [compost metagenome]
MDSNGLPLPSGSVGELVVRGPHVTLGYWRDELTTQRFFRTWNFGNEVVLFTGDLCSMDQEGYLYYHGRKDDIFKLRGYRVSCTEIERSALSIDGIHQAAVLIPTLEEPAALIVTSDLSIDEIREELRHSMEYFKIPDMIEKVEKMPLSANGKYDLKALRQYVKGVITQ